MKKDTRNYGKNFIRGGPVPTSSEEAERWSGERATEDDLADARDTAIEKTGAGDPKEYELERNRSKSVVKDSEPFIAGRPPPAAGGGGYEPIGPDDDAYDELDRASQKRKK